MNLFDLQQLSLPLVIAIYFAASGVVWIAGTKASRYADEVSRRTGIGGAVVGMVMLGAITSLPEIGTSATAALGGNAGLAVSNLLGGVAFQIVVLAAVDVFTGKDALTAKAPDSSILLQAVVCILLLALAVAGTIAGDPGIIGVGMWTTGMLVTYGLSILFVRNQERHARWVPRSRTAKPGQPVPVTDSGEKRDERGPLRTRLIVSIILAGAAILAAGFVLTRSAEAIAGQTGLNTNLAGLTLLAVATSLPELSTATSAVKIGRNDLAIGNVLGGNMFDLMLIFFVDVLYVGPPVLGQVGGFASFAGLLGIILTAIYLIGMIERRDRTTFKIGYDSLLVLLFYAGGMALIFSVATGAGPK